MSQVNGHRKDDKKEKYKTPPMVQQPHFANQPQQYYYYVQTPVYHPGMMPSSPPPNAQGYNPKMNLMSPPQFNYSPVSPAHKYPASKQHPNYNAYGQSSYDHQYSPKGNYKPPYSPKRYNSNSGNKPNQGWVSPRKPVMNKNPKGKSGHTKSPGDRNKKQTSSPAKYNSRVKLNDGKEVKTTPLTSNTNIKKDFVIEKLDDYKDYERALNAYSAIAENAEEHSLVTKINTSNCLEKKCLNLLKKPVFDVLYELDMDKYISLDSFSDGEDTIEMDNEFDDLILDEIKNINHKQLDDFFNSLGESLQKSNEENDVSALDSSESSINKSMSSGRMIVLKRNTNFFVSSKSQDPNSSINEIGRAHV
mgnify:FL=1